MSYIDLVSKENYDKDIDKIVVKANASGEVIRVDDSSDNFIKDMKVESDEETVDVQVFGKNMYVMDNLPITKDGITLSKDDNGNILLNGKSTKESGQTTFLLESSLFLKKGTVYTTSVESKIKGVGIELRGKNNELSMLTLPMTSSYTTNTKTQENDLELKGIYVNVLYSTVELNNFILNPQVEIGNKRTKFESAKPMQSATINVSTQTGWEKLKTYYPTTTITPKQNAKIDVTYVADTKVYIDEKDVTKQVELNSAQIADISAYVGLTSDYAVGLQADFENKTFTRLGGAVGLEAGEDFNKFNMYGGRKRCNVDDDGKITAYYGDDNYKEDGTNGQVMVYQPKFYYLVSPLKLDKQESGLGYHLRKANYYVSDKKLNGFKLHPAFYDAYGNEVDYILIGAYEGCIYDTSESKYLMNDEQVADFTTDKLSSIAGAKPCSKLTKKKYENLANNRSGSFHIETIKTVSVNQLLTVIEYGKFNMQDSDALGEGIVEIPNVNGINCSSLTGSTSSLGNSSGMATETINTKGEESTTETENGKVAISYRGMENPYGNIWKFINGINIWGNGNMGNGVPYICNNYNFYDNKNTDNYEKVETEISVGFISAFGYSEKYDWLFIPSQGNGSSSLPIGDNCYAKNNLNGYSMSLFGGSWLYNLNSGMFFFNFELHYTIASQSLGARLVYIPNSSRTDIEDVEVAL